MSVLTALALASALCGASPQEGRSPRPQPQAPRDSPHSAPAFRPAPPPRQVDSNRTDTRGLRPDPDRVGRRSSGGTYSAPLNRGVHRDLRTTRVNLYPGTRVVMPPAWDRCTSMPDSRYWHRRDILAEIQWLSRSGFVPVTPLGDAVEAISDYAQLPAGWRAYGLSVPAGGTVQVEVQHTKLGWFRLMLVDRWGKPGPGMLQAAIAHQPVMVTYRNPGKEATAVYVIVDDPAWWSGPADPYSLMVRRDWDPAKTDLSQVKMVAGLWGASPSVSAEFRGPSLTGPAVYPWPSVSAEFRGPLTGPAVFP